MSDAVALRVVDPGLLSTVQDLGRRGVASFGVSPAGAADWFAARAANRLVGNPDGAALIETTLSATVFAPERRMLVAVTGAQADVVSGGVRRSAWSSWRCEPGDRLEIGAPRAGLRSYIAIEGGIAVTPTLGSASTDVVSGFGGRVLAPGDRIAAAPSTDPAFERAPLRYPPEVGHYGVAPFLLRALPGPHERVLAPVAGALVTSAYRVGPRSSRQALRLDGAKSDLAEAREVVSTGVCAGCVQIAGDGLPTLLLVEHQTTGGYPVALCVITADLPAAAQAQPGDVVRFERVTLGQAAEALAARAQALGSLGPAVAHGRVDARRLAGGFFEGATP